MYRKLMHQGFNARATHKYWPLQEREAHVLLGGLLKTPENMVQHVRRYASDLGGKVIDQVASDIPTPTVA